MRVNVLAVTLLLGVACASRTAFAAIDIGTTFGTYLDDFNARRPADALISSYWQPPVSIVTPEEVLSLSRRQLVRWIGDIQEQIDADGWLRSELVESAVCPLSETSALYSVRFKRFFDDGREMTRTAVYTLLKTDTWRIVTLALADRDTTISCQ